MLCLLKVRGTKRNHKARILLEADCKIIIILKGFSMKIVCKVMNGDGLI